MGVVIQGHYTNDRLVGVGFSGILVPGTRKYFLGRVSDTRSVNSLQNSQNSDPSSREISDENVEGTEFCTI